MAEALSALAAVSRSGRGGVATGAPGLVIVERRPLTIVQVSEIPGVAGNRSALEKALGLALPHPGKAAAADARAALWVGPGRWFVVEQGRGDLATRLETAAAGSLAVTDLSHSRTVLRLWGAKVFDVLAKGCAVDLHPRSVAAGDSIVTGLARHAVVLHVVDAAPTVDVYVYRSFGQDLFEWLTEAASEYGYEVAASQG
jgi:heterotetrameric sarcosine oxidase gamma subunit